MFVVVGKFRDFFLETKKDALRNMFCLPNGNFGESNPAPALFVVVTGGPSSSRLLVIKNIQKVKIQIKYCFVDNI